MSEKGFASLVQNLTEPVVRPLLTLATELQGPAEGPAELFKDLHASASSSETGKSLDTPHPDRPDSAEAAALLPARVIGSAPLYSWERDALKDYYLLIRTPRAATRLLNTYRLVRAGVSAQEWDSFRGGEGGRREFRVAMLLLAAAAGQPAVAREWFRLLRRGTSLSLSLPDDAAHSNRREWSVFRRLYDDTSRQLANPLTNDVVAKWLDRVELFAF
jgi:hypothetical protein